MSFHQGAPPPEDVKVDIWDDIATMTLLKTHTYLPDLRQTVHTVQTVHTYGLSNIDGWGDMFTKSLPLDT